MGYNKPITARIQHSTNMGMKVQDPLLDIGSVNKKTELNYGPDASLISGAADLGAASQPVDMAKEVGRGMDEGKPTSKPKKEKETPEDPKAPGAPEKKLGPKGVGKNYKKGYYGK